MNHQSVQHSATTAEGKTSNLVIKAPQFGLVVIYKQPCCQSGQIQQGRQPPPWQKENQSQRNTWPCLPVIGSVPCGGEDLLESVRRFLHRVVQPKNGSNSLGSGTKAPVNVAVLYVLDLLPDLDEGVAEPGDKFCLEPVDKRRKELRGTCPAPPCSRTRWVQSSKLQQRASSSLVRGNQSPSAAWRCRRPPHRKTSWSPARRWWTREQPALHGEIRSSVKKIPTRPSFPLCSVL